MVIDKQYQLPRSHLFTARIWEEEVSSDQSEWCGKVQLVNSEDVRYFRHWSALAPLRRVETIGRLTRRPTGEIEIILELGTNNSRNLLVITPLSAYIIPNVLHFVEQWR